MTARVRLYPSRRVSHAHSDALSPGGVATWFACPACQHGHPLRIAAETATAISTILTNLTKGGTTT